MAFLTFLANFRSNYVNYVNYAMHFFSLKDHLAPLPTLVIAYIFLIHSLPILDPFPSHSRVILER